MFVTFIDIIIIFILIKLSYNKFFNKNINHLMFTKIIVIVSKML